MSDSELLDQLKTPTSGVLLKTFDKSVTLDVTYNVSTDDEPISGSKNFLNSRNNV